MTLRSLVLSTLLLLSGGQLYGTEEVPSITTDRHFNEYEQEFLDAIETIFAGTSINKETLFTCINTYLLISLKSLLETPSLMAENANSGELKMMRELMHLRYTLNAHVFNISGNAIPALFNYIQNPTPEIPPVLKSFEDKVRDIANNSSLFLDLLWTLPEQAIASYVEIKNFIVTIMSDPEKQETIKEIISQLPAHNSIKQAIELKHTLFSIEKREELKGLLRTIFIEQEDHPFATISEEKINLFFEAIITFFQKSNDHTFHKCSDLITMSFAYVPYDKEAMQEIITIAPDDCDEVRTFKEKLQCIIDTPQEELLLQIASERVDSAGASAGSAE